MISVTAVFDSRYCHNGNSICMAILYYTILYCTILYYTMYGYTITYVENLAYYIGRAR